MDHIHVVPEIEGKNFALKNRALACGELVGEGGVVLKRIPQLIGSQGFLFLQQYVLQCTLGTEL